MSPAQRRQQQQRHPHVFFTLPTTRYRPDDYIQLGQVISDPITPYERLAAPVVPLTGHLKPRIVPEKEWSARSTTSDFFSVGLFARVLDALTAEISRKGQGTETTEWEAAKVETQYFEPRSAPPAVAVAARGQNNNTEDGGGDKGGDLDLAAELVKNAAVKKYLNGTRFRGGSAYLITGIKIARNPKRFKMSSGGKSEIGAKLQATVDPQSAAAVGAEGSSGSQGDAEETSVPMHDYVFAYRMSKLYVNWLTGKAKIGKEMDGGDLAGVPYDEEDEGFEESDPGEYDSEGNRDDGGDDADWEIMDASIEDEDVGTNLPSDGFDVQEVEGEGEEATTYRLVTVKGF